MTELEKIAYNNGLACGFLVARGIAKNKAVQAVLDSDDFVEVANELLPEPSD